MIMYIWIYKGKNDEIFESTEPNLKKVLFGMVLFVAFLDVGEHKIIDI